MGAPKLDITQMMQNYNQGEREALERLLPLVYAQLKRMAAKQLRGERAGYTLQPTALVNELFMQLLKKNKLPYESRTHFYAAAAQLMRWILLDRAKAKNAQKRHGKAIRVTFVEDLAVANPEEGMSVLDIDEALNKLAQIDPRRAKVVELRFFGGLGIEEVALALGASTGTVKRDWNFAKAWLRREILKKNQVS